MREYEHSSDLEPTILHIIHVDSDERRRKKLGINTQQNLLKRFIYMYLLSTLISELFYLLLT